MLGEDHPLNVSNALAGLVYYTIMMFLSKCMCVCVQSSLRLFCGMGIGQISCLKLGVGL